MNQAKRRYPIVTVAICVAAMGLVACALLSFGPSLLVAFASGRVPRSFYIPSQSMMPTLELNDRIFPMSVQVVRPTRGAIVIFTVGKEDRVDRIVAIAGDSVTVRGGRVVVNGRTATYRAGGAGPTFDGEPSQIEFERLPGEDHEHSVLDLGMSRQDDFAEVTVPQGNVFVLGDNRDRAADSRFPRDQMGVGMVPIDKIIGTVDTLYWSQKHWRIGQPIDEVAPTP